MKHYCLVKDEEINIDGQIRNFKSPSDVDWKSYFYKSLGLSYSKFYKMDDLSKLTILGASYLDQIDAFNSYDDESVSMIFCNSSSSTHADKNYLDSLESGNPSPSLFVYTLPNICVGEFTIFKKYYGPGCFYISDSLIEFQLADLINIELNKGFKAVLFCWVERLEEKDFGLFSIFEEPVKTEDQNFLNRLINK